MQKNEIFFSQNQNFFAQTSQTRNFRSGTISLRKYGITRTRLATGRKSSRAPWLFLDLCTWLSNPANLIKQMSNIGPSRTSSHNLQTGLCGKTLCSAKEVFASFLQQLSFVRPSIINIWMNSNTNNMLNNRRKKRSKSYSTQKKVSWAALTKMRKTQMMIANQIQKKTFKVSIE